MPSTIVVGGQYGSEGKGKVVSLLAQDMDSPWVVRCGGPNSGHTVTVRGQSQVLQQVPSSPEHPEASLLIGAGSVIDERILIDELDLLGISRRRIFIDPRAVIVSDEDRIREHDELDHIASTYSGTGAALIRRMSRRDTIGLARDSEVLRGRCTVQVVADLLHDVLDRGGNVLVEGTQGFALSLLHGPHYPYLTARDTTASGFATEVGLSPRHINNIVMVLRTFPIRVGGKSGPLPNEIRWEEIQTASGAPQPMPEYTSVTRTLRRVAKFDIEAVKTACRFNAPTSLAIMGLDRLDYANRGVSDYDLLTPTAKEFIAFVESNTGVCVRIVGTGFTTHEGIRIHMPKESPALAHV